MKASGIATSTGCFVLLVITMRPRCELRAMNLASTSPCCIASNKSIGVGRRRLAPARVAGHGRRRHAQFGGEKQQGHDEREGTFHGDCRCRTRGSPVRAAWSEAVPLAVCDPFSINTLDRKSKKTPSRGRSGRLFAGENAIIRS